MGAIDPARRLVRLASGELAAATSLLAGEGHVAEGLEPGMEALTRAGMVVEGSLHPAVAQVVAVVSEPRLLLTLETRVGGAVVAHRAWAAAELAVVGRSVAEDVVEYTATDLVLVPFFLAALVGLGRRPAAGPAGPFMVGAPALDAVSAMVEEGDLRAATDRLVADGVPGGQAGTLVEVLARRRVSWRAVATWAVGPNEVRSRSLTVVDAGAAGLWRCLAAGPEEAADAGPDATLELAPLAPSQAWRELTALIPLPGPGPAD